MAAIELFESIDGGIGIMPRLKLGFMLPTWESPDYPAEADVRFGVSYAMGEREGTLKHQIYAPLEITESSVEVVEL